jgi:signal transduction histidine kinase
MTAPSASPDQATTADTVASDLLERGPVRWTNRQVLILARTAWLAIALLTVGLFLVSLPLDYTELERLHDSLITNPRLLTAGLAELGIAVQAFAAYALAVKVIFAAVYVGIAVLLFRRRSDEPIVLLISFTLMTLGVTSLLTRPVLTDSDRFLNGPISLLSNLAFATFFLLCYLFPDGRFVPRWTIWPAALWMVVQGLITALPTSPLSPQHWPAVLAAPLFFGVIASMVYAPVYRYRRVSTTLQRQQTKWVACGLALAIAGFVLGMLPGTLTTFLRPAPAEALDTMSRYALAAGTFLVMPVALAIAVMRYRLWDIDLIINRALVYTTLTASLVALYVLVVGGLGAILHIGFSPVISFVAAGLVAVLLAPLRARLQRAINRLMFGERDEPYAVLTRLGERLESTITPDTVLSVIVQTVTEALRLPYAAVVLQDEADAQTVVEVGRPMLSTAEFPLTYQQEMVGRLLVAPRVGEEVFGPSDRRLLDDLARQAGVAVHALQLHARALRLAADLQRSRERLVTTREEERRRLRRDLHDSIGPTLSSLTHRLDLAADLVRSEPNAAVDMLMQFKGQVKNTVADIRQLVYALRPPALDDFGLLPAIREHVTQQTEASGLHVDIEAPDPMPALPAAIEVAVYRIVLEAITNVVRHARARTCRIQISIDGALCLTIEDDGRGLPSSYVRGVGLSSMHERAVELGGRCEVERRPSGGTRIYVQLPLAWE